MGARSSVTLSPPYHPGSSAGNSTWTGLLQGRPCDAVGGMLFGFLRFLMSWGFTVNSVFHPSIHMTVDGLQPDSLVNPTCFKVHIKCLKTDPFHMGCDIYVGRGEGSVCPILALGDFLALHGSSEGPLFTVSDGRPLTRQQLSSTVQSILHSAGYIGSYSGHIFCIGAATTATALGVPDHLNKTLGRWSSDAYHIYIRTPFSSIVHVSRRLVT